jgi:hypothetical protein
MSLVSLTPRAVHCSLLAEDAIKSAIKDYQVKREKRLSMASVSNTFSPRLPHRASADLTIW